LYDSDLKRVRKTCLKIDIFCWILATDFGTGLH
jgi:hypothetical protein